MNDLQFRVNEIYSYIQQSDEESQRKLSASKGLKASANRTPPKLGRSIGASGPNIDIQLEALEDRMARRMAESVESLGEIIKEYANKY